jgi:uncharacterized protein (TIGR02996 family)
MSEEQALLAAIIAHPEEDTPRLAYADWLDENEAPIQADFIRTRCRLASCSAADPDYPDLIERRAELLVQFQPMVKQTVPELPPGFSYDDDLGNPGTFRRGFLDTVGASREDFDQPGWPPSNEDIEQLCDGLAQLIATTTARKLALRGLIGEQLDRVLAAPGADRLTGLAVFPADYSTAGGDEALGVLAGAAVTARLATLGVYGLASAAGLNALAGVKFQRLAHFDPPTLRGGGALAPVTGSKWFGALRTARVPVASTRLERELVAAYAKLPRLEALEALGTSAACHTALGTPRGFPALARLEIGTGPGATSAARLARARFPRLAELEIRHATTAGTLPLVRARWFPQLRCLSVGHKLTDRFVLALAKSGAAPHLRILRLGENPFSAPALSALGDGTRFPALTTLDLGSIHQTGLTPAQLARFARGLNLPRIQHLNLGGWPLCDAGARALAENPSLAHLTRLGLRNCKIGEKGLAALVRSPHLQQLIELDVQENKLKTAAAALDTDLLPRLAALRLDGNPLAAGAHRKLQKVRGLVV